MVWRKIIHTKLALPLKYEVIEDLFSQKKTDTAGAGDAQETKKQQQPTEVKVISLTNFYLAVAVFLLMHSEIYFQSRKCEHLCGCLYVIRYAKVAT